MLLFLTSVLLLAQSALSAPVENVAAATVGKIRGVRDPIYHLYLQANSKNGRRLHRFSGVNYCVSYYMLMRSSVDTSSWARSQRR